MSSRTTISDTLHPNSEIKNIAINCPSCGAELNAVEIEEQECFTCGWPDPWDGAKPAEPAASMPPAGR